MRSIEMSQLGEYLHERGLMPTTFVWKLAEGVPTELVQLWARMKTEAPLVSVTLREAGENQYAEYAFDA